MKKLLLSLLCIGSILALPGCWCCRQAYEEPCEDYCEEYDECNKECYDGDDGEVIEREYQQGYETGRKYRKGSRHYDDEDEVTGREYQQGYVTKEYHRRKGEQPKGPRPIKFKSVHPVLDEAMAAGKECKLIDPRFHRLNKQQVKQDRMAESSRKRSNKMMNEEKMEMMDQE